MKWSEQRQQIIISRVESREREREWESSRSETERVAHTAQAEERKKFYPHFLQHTHISVYELNGIKKCHKMVEFIRLSRGSW